MIELARKASRRLFLACDIEELELEPASYDLIVSNATIHG